MLHMIGKAALIAALPKLIDKTIDYFTKELEKVTLFAPEPKSEIPLFEPEPVIEVEPESIKQDRKCRDTTKYTQYMFDYIQKAHKMFVEHNKSVRTKEKNGTMKIDDIGIMGVDDLAKVINETMGTTKSRSSLATIWNNKVDRNTLAVGEPNFEWGI